MATILLKLPERLWARLELACRTQHTTKSSLIRECLEARLGQSPIGKKASCYELAYDLAGSIKGLPSDLATNRRYMAAFGQRGTQDKHGHSFRNMVAARRSKAAPKLTLDEIQREVENHRTQKRPRAQHALQVIRQRAKKRGLDRMPMNDINAIIAKTRKANAGAKC